MSKSTFQHTVKERFLHYVTIDTESDPESNTYPSTEKQKDLGFDHSFRVHNCVMLLVIVPDGHGTRTCG
jgi:di/tripeptidase